ncbi:ATP-dependent metallopeptidase FtsH/Yme1/Tma family protein, partial [Patescibacteria group bacterium]|nr:ATP-dependent metallopeptidase FtsH/Yme1/Tma family protein [Patescibacteria group bacterium]
MGANGKRNHVLEGRKKSVKIKAKFSWKNIFLYGFLIIFSLFIFSALSSPYEDRKTIPLSELISDIKKGQVSKIVISGDKLLVNLKNGTLLQAVKES